MKLQNHAKTLVGFAAGFICAGLLAAFLLTTQNVQASFRDYTCIKQSMTWDGMATNQVNEDIWVRYKVPSC